MLLRDLYARLLLLLAADFSLHRRCGLIIPDE